jgi:hypothetical protein
MNLLHRKYKKEVVKLSIVIKKDAWKPEIKYCEQDVYFEGKDLKINKDTYFRAGTLEIFAVDKLDNKITDKYNIVAHYSDHITIICNTRAIADRDIKAELWFTYIQ